MKTILLTLVAVAGVASAQEIHWVNGYQRRDGTQVSGHYQTNPNETVNDNWTTRGNYNPYTGVQGTRDPYQPRYERGYGSRYDTRYGY